MIPIGFWRGVDLYRAGKAPLLLFTGGSSPYRPDQSLEGNLYIKEAQFLGIAGDVIASTPPVMNTADEAVAIRK